MATMTQALSPAEAQPVAFTAEYLLWGACYFPEPSCAHEIGRGLYSVGVIVVAPVGILYHLSMAAYGALAQLRLDAGKEKAELSSWAWQHLDVAGNDVIGWVSALIVPALIACVVAFSVFAVRGEVARAILYLTPFLAFLFEDNVLQGMMPYAYAKNPLFLRVFLKLVAPEGASASQDDLFVMRYALQSEAFPYVLNTPLSDQEIAAFMKGPFRDMVKGDQFSFHMISLPAHLKQFNRVAEEERAENERIVSKKKELQAIATNKALSFDQQCEAADQLINAAAATPPEVKENPADTLVQELAPIQAGIEGWKAKLKHLTFPCAIAARIEIIPPAEDRINVPFVAPIAYHFENAEAATLVLNAQYNLIKTRLEQDRTEHARDLQNFGTKSIGYIIPQCKTEMTFVHITPAEEQTYNMTVYKRREVTTEAPGWEQRSVMPGSTLQDGVDTLEEVYGMKGMKSKTTTAMLKLHPQT